MKGTVISYIYTPEGLPGSFRQHEVPNVHNHEAISAQVRVERISVPRGYAVGWSR